MIITAHYGEKLNIRTPYCGKAGCVPPQLTHDGLPIIPGRPDNPAVPADGAVAQCGVCGLRIPMVVGYVCSNPRCGVFPQVMCAT